MQSKNILLDKRIIKKMHPPYVRESPAQYEKRINQIYLKNYREEARKRVENLREAHNRYTVKKLAEHGVKTSGKQRLDADAQKHRETMHRRSEHLDKIFRERIVKKPGNPSNLTSQHLTDKAPSSVVSTSHPDALSNSTPAYATIAAPATSAPAYGAIAAPYTSTPGYAANATPYNSLHSGGNLEVEEFKREPSSPTESSTEKKGTGMAPLVVGAIAILSFIW